MVRFKAAEKHIAYGEMEANITKFSRLSGRVRGFSDRNSQTDSMWPVLQIVFAPSDESIAKGEPFCIHVRPGDFVIPMCHEGMNRSQVQPRFLHVYTVFQRKCLCR